MAYQLTKFPRRGKYGPEIEMRVDNDYHGPCLYNTQETAVTILMSPREARELAQRLSALADYLDLATYAEENNTPRRTRDEAQPSLKT